MSKGIKYVAALPPLIVDAHGNASLEGFRCQKCSVVVVDKRIACPSCGDRGGLERVRLGAEGTLHTWTTVHRTYGNVQTPFFSVVVDLDGGGSLKGTLLDYDVTAQPPPGLRVRVVFRETGQHDSEGRAFLCYFFVAAQGNAA
jgi:uncharacterized protein